MDFSEILIKKEKVESLIVVDSIFFKDSILGLGVGYINLYLRFFENLLFLMCERRDFVVLKFLGYVVMLGGMMLFYYVVNFYIEFYWFYYYVLFYRFLVIGEKELVIGYLFFYFFIKCNSCLRGFIRDEECFLL